MHCKNTVTTVCLHCDTNEAGGGVFKSQRRTDCLEHPPDHLLSTRSAHLWELTRLLTSHNKMLMAAPSSTPRLSVSYTPNCPNLLHKQPHLIWSRLSIPELREGFQWFHLRGLPPQKLPVGRRPFLPALQQPVCLLCSPSCSAPTVGAPALKSPPLQWHH